MLGSGDSGGWVEGYVGGWSLTELRDPRAWFDETNAPPDLLDAAAPAAGAAGGAVSGAGSEGPGGDGPGGDGPGGDGPGGDGLGGDGLGGDGPGGDGLGGDDPFAGEIARFREAIELVELLRAAPSSGDFDALLTVLQRLERLRARVDARMVRLLAIAELDPPPRPTHLDSARRGWARLEVATALCWSSYQTTARMREAAVLAVRLPETLDFLETGRISLLHAATLAEAISVLDDPQAVRAVERRVLPRAATQTRGEFRQAVTRAVSRYDARGEAQRHRHARRCRDVTITPAPDGMAWLSAYLAAEDAATVKTAVDTVASTSTSPGPGGGPGAGPGGGPGAGPGGGGQGAGERAAANAPAGDARSMGERRADALVAIAAAALAGDLCGQLGALPAEAGHRPGVNVTIAASTLLGLDDQPGELAGHGPIPAALARAIAADPTGTWRRLITDPTGRLLDRGRRTYRPPVPLREHVTTRDQTCRFPGCRRAATRCDLDHVVAWAAGGTTDAANLIALCPRHHHAKHDAGWHVTAHPDGSLTWTSPTGRDYNVPAAALPIDTTSEADGNAGAGNDSEQGVEDPYAPAPDAVWPPPGYDPWDDPEHEIRPAPRPRPEPKTPPPALPDDPPF